MMHTFWWSWLSLVAGNSLKCITCQSTSVDDACYKDPTKAKVEDCGDGLDVCYKLLTTHESDGKLNQVVR